METTNEKFKVDYKNEHLLEIKDLGEDHTDAIIFMKIGVVFDKTSLHTYIRDAKRILNKESKNLNRVGIQRLIAALLIEVYGNENYGEDN